MFEQIFESAFRAVGNQGYEIAYADAYWSIPGSLITSVPMALVSGIMAILNIAQAVFQKIKDGTPFFGSTNDRGYSSSYPPMENAIDLSIIFVNNVVNICTLGILNHLLVRYVVSESRWRRRLVDIHIPDNFVANT